MPASTKSRIGARGKRERTRLQRTSAHSLRFRGLKPAEVTWGAGPAFQGDTLQIAEVIWRGAGWNLRVRSIGFHVVSWHPTLTIAGANVDKPHRGIGFPSLAAARDHAAKAFGSVRRVLAKESA